MQEVGAEEREGEGEQRQQMVVEAGVGAVGAGKGEDATTRSSGTDPGSRAPVRNRRGVPC